MYFRQHLQIGCYDLKFLSLKTVVSPFFRQIRVFFQWQLAMKIYFLKVDALAITN